MDLGGLKDIILYILFATLAGWIAGLIVKGEGNGFVQNAIVGLIGAVIGGVIFKLCGIPIGDFFGALITGMVGGVIFLSFFGSKKKT